MYTQCPTCETLFRVSDEDLAAADGEVRCSRCDGVFDAKLHMHAAPAPDEPAPELVPLGRGAEPAIGDLFGADDATLDDAHAPLDADALGAVAGLDGAPTPVAGRSDGPDVHDDFPPLPPAGRPRERSGRWIAASALLGATLLGQLVHANRDHLARDPAVGTLVVDAYQALALPIVAPTDLGALAVARAEVTSHPVYDGVLYITATVTNDAPFPQPLPLLRVRLDDRWGEPLGERMFAPADYLRSPPPDGARAEPGKAYAIALEVLDPGNDAVGYALAPCLPLGDAIVCAGDDPGAR